MWRFTGFYGFADHSQRHKSWKLLRNLAVGNSLPWVIGGDFNEILSNAEKEGGVPRLPAMIEAFRSALEDCGLSDIGFEGDPFTWNNNREKPDTIRCRLDRICVSRDWISMFPNHRVNHVKSVGSDNKPLVLRLCIPSWINRSRNSKPYRFEAMWIRHDECARIIKETWEEGASSSNPFEKWREKSDACRIGLIRWSKDVLSKPRKRIAEIQEKLHAIQLGHVTVQSKAEISVLQKQLEQLYGDLDMYWRQRSRIKWVQEGDRNTSFFHSKASTRNRANKIMGLENQFGEWKNNPSDLEHIVTDYFGDIFKSCNPNPDELREVVELMNPRVSDEANQMLIQPYTSKEVTTTLSQMAPLKSPGPDGMPVIFYQKYWRIIGREVTKCILEFLNKRRIPGNLNFTHIVLIPKVKNPKRVGEFRPISLSNVIYKIGSKMITNRIKSILNNIISPTQSAFVPNRLITDNILVAFEVNHFIRTKIRKNHNFMAVKLDISKAYDRIEWGFLRQVLMRFGFHDSVVELIMLCVSTVTYSFLVNGSQCGFIRPSRGLRQGDPLSPYLFIMCAEILVTMIEHENNRGRLEGIKIAPGAPVISNLCFADDTLIFCHASVNAATRLKYVLERYARISGQIINVDKSSMNFSRGTLEDLKHSIQHILGFNIVEAHDKYLGMPAMVGRSKNEIFSFLRDRVWTRIKGWGEKQLSKAGKEVLIKVVLQSIPTYLMGCFVLPSTLIRDIEMAIRRFWWGDGSTNNKMNWISWSRLCAPKNAGGMGFRDLKSFNLALLAKQGWRLLTCPDSLAARLLKARYYPTTEFLKADLGVRPSSIWRSILHARPFLENGLRKRIGNGKSTAIWGDAWLHTDGAFKIITKRPIHTSFPDKVSDLVDYRRKVWNENIINKVFWQVDKERIWRIPIGNFEAEDRYVWHYSRNGNFDVKSCYHNTFAASHRGNGGANGSGSGVEKKQWNLIWNMKLPPKVRIFVWRACNGILPTSHELYRRRVSNSAACIRCGDTNETIMHVVSVCKGMDSIWSAPPFDKSCLEPEISNYSTWLEQLMGKCSSDEVELAVILSWKAWHNRNQDVHGSTSMAAGDMLAWGKLFREEYNRAKFYVRQDNTRLFPDSWHPPNAGTIKLNFDVAFPVGKNLYNVAIVARDSNGECVWWSRRQLFGRPRPVEGEARAALHAIMTAKEKAWPSVIFEGDCLEVISALKCDEENFSTYGALIQECRSVLNCFDNHSFSFVKRNGNNIAHCLATSVASVIGREGDSLPTLLAQDA